MYSTYRCMSECCHPMDCSDCSGYKCDKRHPPQDACYLTLLLMNSLEPVACAEMQKQMIRNKSDKQYSYQNVYPHRYNATAMDDLQLYSGYENCNSKSEQAPVAYFQFSNLLHLKIDLLILCSLEAFTGACYDAFHAANTLFCIVEFHMTMPQKVIFTRNTFRARAHTFPTGDAIVRIYSDVFSLITGSEPV